MYKSYGDPSDGSYQSLRWVSQVMPSFPRPPFARREPGSKHERCRSGRQRLPSRNCPHADPGRLVVGDPREMPPELDHGGEFAALLEHLTDRRGRGLVDAEHGVKMGRRSARGKRKLLASGATDDNARCLDVLPAGRIALMLRCSIIIRQARPISRPAKAGHLARLEDGEFR